MARLLRLNLSAYRGFVMTCEGHRGSLARHWPQISTARWEMPSPNSATVHHDPAAVVPAINRSPRKSAASPGRQRPRASARRGLLPTVRYGITSGWTPPYDEHSGNLCHTSPVSARNGSAGSRASHTTSFPNPSTRENAHSKDWTSARRYRHDQRRLGRSRQLTQVRLDHDACSHTPVIRRAVPLVVVARGRVRVRWCGSAQPGW